MAEGIFDIDTAAEIQDAGAKYIAAHDIAGCHDCGILSSFKIDKILPIEIEKLLGLITKL